MNGIALCFVVLCVAGLALICIVLRSKYRQDVMKRLSDKKLRYAFAVLPLIGIVGIVFPPLISHATYTAHNNELNPDITYIACGSEAQMPLTNNDPGSNQWSYVAAGTTANTSGGPIVARGYTGAAHDINHSSQNCSGDYHYAWDQYYHKATWSWSTTSVTPLQACRVSAYIPTWYAGAPDATYTLSIYPNPSSSALTFIKDQNLPTGGAWVLLDFSHDGQGYVPLGGNNYTFTVTLQNGGGQGRWWYLGADAMKFECNYSGASSPDHNQPVQNPPVHQQPVQNPPVHQQPVQNPPVHQQPVQNPPVHQQPVQNPPAHQQPVQNPPSHVQPVQNPPAHQQPIQNPPVHLQPLPKHGEHHQPLPTPPVHQQPLPTTPNRNRPL